MRFKALLDQCFLCLSSPVFAKGSRSLQISSAALHSCVFSRVPSLLAACPICAANYIFHTNLNLAALSLGHIHMVSQLLGQPLCTESPTASGWLVKWLLLVQIPESHSLEVWEKAWCLCVPSVCHGQSLGIVASCINNSSPWVSPCAWIIELLGRK